MYVVPIHLAVGFVLFSPAGTLTPEAAPEAPRPAPRAGYALNRYA